jgi:hypothetical protein
MPPLPDVLAPTPAPVDEPMPSEPPAAAATEAPPGQAAAPASARGRRTRRIALAAAAATSLLAAGAWLALDRFAPRPAAPPPAPPPVARAAAAPPRTFLAPLALHARLPPGWRIGPAGDALAAKTSLLFRGASAKDPEAGLYLGVMPLDQALAGRPTDEALLAAAERGHKGGVALMTSHHASYQPGACRVVTVGGRRAGMCVGSASHEGKSVSVQTYVVVGGQRALLALSMSRGGGGAAADADHILASLSGL